MKKIDCGVITDLLPLYLDECCTDASKKMVEEHLQECEECKKIYRTYIEELEPKEETSFSPEIAEIKVEYRRLKRWKRRGFGVAALCVCLAVLVTFLGINQYRGDGISFANIGTILRVHQFAKAIENGDYEKAYQYFDIEGEYQDLMEGEYEEATIASNVADIEEKGFAWYNQVCLDSFLAKIETLNLEGEKIAELSRYYITSAGEGWQVGLHGQLENGQIIRLEIMIDKAGINPRSVDVLSPTFNAQILGTIYKGTDVDWETPLGNEDFVYVTE